MARKVLIVVGKEESLEKIDTSEFVKSTLIDEFEFNFDTLLNHKLRAHKIIENLKDIFRSEYPSTLDFYFYLNCSIGIAIDILRDLKSNWKSTYHLIVPVYLGNELGFNPL